MRKLHQENSEALKNWKWVKLGEVLSVSSGKGIKVNSLQGGKYAVYGGNGLNGYHSEYFLEDPKLIIGRVGVKCGVMHITKPKSWVTDNALIIEPKNDAFDIKFLKLKLGFENLNKLSVSTAQPVISGSKIYAYEILLPPKPTQEAIVSKIEELFSEIEKGIESLSTAKQQLKTYRQSVLKWAFEGKLTNGLNHDSYDLHDEHDLKLAAEPCNDYSSDKVEFPKGWKRVKLGDIAKRKTIKALPKDFPNAKFIGMDCIEPHTLKPFFLYNFKEFKSAGNYFKKNQVLYGRMRPYLNKVYRAEFDGTCSGEFIILDCANDFNPDLLKYILHSRGFVSFANSITTGDRPRISYEEISEYDVLLPPREEQNTIVLEIESRLSVADKMEASINESLQQAKGLKQSILKKAFEGKLK